MDEYIARCRVIASKCKFTDLMESNIRLTKQLIVGTKHVEGKRNYWRREMPWLVWKRQWILREHSKPRRHMSPSCKQQDRCRCMRLCQRGHPVLTRLAVDVERRMDRNGRHAQRTDRNVMPVADEDITLSSVALDCRQRVHHRGQTQREDQSRMVGRTERPQKGMSAAWTLWRRISQHSPSRLWRSATS